MDSIVLTTHSMEEADVLCDRLGIVASGLLKCLGTNVHLKEKFGSGYTIKVNFDPNDEKKVIDFIMVKTTQRNESKQQLNLLFCFFL